MGQIYQAVRRRSNLEAAARWVCAKGRASAAKEIRREVEVFEQRWTSHIQALERQLRRERFRFLPQRAVLIPRPNKKPRPIVIAPLPNRIVQRAILQALNDVPGIKAVLSNPWSVGGIEGIDKGIALVRQAIIDGAAWYLRADIPNFFGSIPRLPIVQFVSAATNDEILTGLFERAVETTLVNVNDLTEDELDLLPDEVTGVAQGSALSTLIGNILLRDFDSKMQGNGVRCIRYVDDFILLAPRKGQVVGAFKSAQAILANWGIAAYEPNDGSGKAELAAVSDGLDFLGCRVDGSLVAPGEKAREDLIENVRQILADGRRAVRNAVAGRLDGLKGRREAQTIRQVDLVVNGWGQAFAFCNAVTVNQHLDERILEMIERFRDANARLAATLPISERSRVLGITRLTDIRRKPLSISARVGGLPDPHFAHSNK